MSNSDHTCQRTSTSRFEPTRVVIKCLSTKRRCNESSIHWLLIATMLIAGCTESYDGGIGELTYDMPAGRNVPSSTDSANQGDAAATPETGSNTFERRESTTSGDSQVQENEDDWTNVPSGHGFTDSGGQDFDEPGDNGFEEPGDGEFDEPGDSDSRATGSVNMPVVCTQSGQPPGGCECSEEPGFTTYTFEHKGEQRCLTVYTNPDSDNQAMPLIIEPDCYSANSLQEPFGGGPHNLAAANDIGFHYMDLTTPSGGWDFPHDNEINDTNYATQCSDSASNDIGYLKGVFMVVDQMIADGLVDPNKVFVHSFSQNAVFALFMATCFPDAIDGIYQVGSGLYSQADGSKALPGCEGSCKKSSFLEHGYDCVQQEPCTTCNYFPVLPVKTGAPIKSCIVMYDDDGAAHSTAVPAYKLLKEQGHQPELKIFAGNPTTLLGDHDAPLNPWAWVLDCLQLYDTCSDSCSISVVSCVEDFKDNYEDGVFSMDNPAHRDAAISQYGVCLAESEDTCTKGCTPTQAMLKLYETPACECDANTVNCSCQTSDKPGACE